MEKSKTFQHNVLQTIGLKLIELRKMKGYNSHESFAFEFGLPRVQYWRLEKGRTNFTIKSLLRILAIHKISVNDFFTNIYEIEKPSGLS